MMFDSLPSAEPQIREGRVRALALCGSARHHLMPDVPTMTEAGVPNMSARSWGGVFAPLNTPKPIVERVERAVRETVAVPEVRQQLARSGGDAAGSTAEELRDLVRTETETWGEVVRAANITPG
jgi:tripartite-type tricarboxylate transporter receptor subunit TctC